MKTNLTKSPTEQCNWTFIRTNSVSGMQRWMVRAVVCSCCLCLGWMHPVKAQGAYTINVAQTEGKAKVELDYKHMVNAVEFEITPPLTGVKISQNGAYVLSIDVNGKATGNLADHVTGVTGSGSIVFDLSKDGTLPLDPGVYDFKIRMKSNDGCYSENVPFQVMVKQLPVLNLMSPEVFCENTDFNITGTIDPISGAVFKYKWKAVVNGTDEEKRKVNLSQGTESGEIDYVAGVNIAEKVTNKNTKPVEITYTVTPIVYYGNFKVEGKAKSVNITVNPQLDLNLSTVTKVLCNNGTTAIELSSHLTGGSVNQVSWTKRLVSGSVPGLSTAPSASFNFPKTIAETLTNDGNAPAVVKYEITQTYTNTKTCTTKDSIEITVNPTPVVTSISDQTVCSGNAATVTLATTISRAEVKYKIEVAGGEQVEGEQGTSVDAAAGDWSTGNLTLAAGTTTPQELTYTVTPKIGSCEGTPVTFTVTVNPSLNVTVDQAKDTICMGNTAAITLNSGVSGVNVVYNITYEANPNIGGLTAIPAQTAVNGASLTWTTPVLTNTTGELQTVKYTITPSVGGTCNGTPVTYEVTVVPAITLDDISALGAICSKDGIGAIDFTSPGLQPSVTDHIVYSWNFKYNSSELDIVAPAGVTIENTGETPADKIATGTGAFTIVTVTNKADAQKSVTVTVQAKYKGLDCAVSVEKTFEVKVNPQPSFELGK